MHSLKQILSLGIMMAVPTLRHPLWHVTIAIIPAGYFLVFFLVGGIEFGRHAVAGAVVSFTINAGIVNLPQILFGLRYRKLQEMFIASPVGPIQYALGVSLSRLFFFSPLILLALFCYILLSPETISVLPAIFLVLCMIWLLGSLFGFLISTYIPSIIYASAISNFFGFLLTLIPPVYYPLEIVPSAFQIPATLVPTVQAARLLRALSGRISLEPVEFYLHLLGLLAWFLISLTIVMYRSRWREP